MRRIAEASTRGQRRLRLLEVDVSLSTIAARVYVSKATVGHWSTGARLPSTAARARLHAVFGIEPSAWDCLPHETPHDARSRQLMTALAEHLGMPLETLRERLRQETP